MINQNPFFQFLNTIFPDKNRSYYCFKIKLESKMFLDSQHWGKRSLALKIT